MANNFSASEPPSISSKVTWIHPSLLLLKIPANTNTSLPVWEAIRSQELDMAWTVNPYSITVHLTPVTSKQGKSTTSGESESTSGMAQTSAPSSSILQPREAIQSIAQQQGAPQITSYVLLNFPQNSNQLLPSPPVQPQKTPPSPTPATAFIVSLPLITLPQPAVVPRIPTKEAALRATQTPTATPTKVQAPRKVPVPSFFTKSSSDIQICDNFLLSLCHAGRKCKMHHTPYPFHWQLCCATSHQWIDIPLHSQVLLERLYCDVNQDDVFIKDGRVYYNLNFDSLELDDESKYRSVRRLTNSDSLVKNPHFPSKRKIYWWNDHDWEEYKENVSTMLLKKMSEKQPVCSFHIGPEEYSVDFTTMMQANVATGFEREVRCRPVYQSPDSMKPYLRTGIQTDPTEAASDPPPANFSVDPLEEFSSWYPPVWSQTSEQDYSLVDVPAGTQAYTRVFNLFYESMSNSEVDIISIQQVQNLLHWDKYQRHKVHMQKQHTNSNDPLERHLFHGTTKVASENICNNNFDPRMAGVNGASFGSGSYFATFASFSNCYSAMAKPNEVCHMFLAKVLVGKVCPGKSNYRRPPPLNSKMKQYCLYDTCVDSMDKPAVYVVFDSCQCYPYYLIKYKDLPREIEI